ncbi:MAG TPA: serine/threonine-protein kinase [Kofleriaceae bacterium]|nr:serine/threonine-protein kinase [Kofleriaceae bacterium]
MATEDDERGTVVDRPTARESKPHIESARDAATAILSSAPGGTGAPGSSLAQADVPSRSSSSSLGGADSLGASMSTIATARGALDHSEVVRTRNFCLVGMTIAAAGLAAIPLLPGGYFTTRLFMVCIGVCIACLVYILYRTRTPETFHAGSAISIAWFIPVVGVTSAIPFFGAMSPAPILLVLGIFFNGLGTTRGVGVATYVICALVQGVTGFLVAFGVMADPGFIHPVHLAREYEVTCQILVQLILAGTFVVARASRRSHLAALSDLEVAVRAIAQRQALLEEARAELRRAMGSTRGRFTDQVIGVYQLGDLIGHGAMGEVYQAVDTRDNQAVAIKMLSRASLGNTQHVERFMRELRTTTAITSPHVVHVLAVGEHPLPHLVMERLRGRDLSAILKSRGTLNTKATIELVRQVAEGLAAAASAGIVHRDIKPQNLFLADGTWKILDFGVARVAASTDTLTQGHVIGTPAYMAPEQARGAQVDHRADIYALAAVIYRALTGHSLFKGGEVADMLYKVVHTAPRKPSGLASVPTDLDFALAIGLAKKPDDRFATAGELADAVEAALTGKLSAAMRERAEKITNAWESEEASPRR